MCKATTLFTTASLVFTAWLICIMLYVLWRTTMLSICPSHAGIFSKTAQQIELVLVSKLSSVVWSMQSVWISWLWSLLLLLLMDYFEKCKCNNTDECHCCFSDVISTITSNDSDKSDKTLIDVSTSLFHCAFITSVLAKHFCIGSVSMLLWVKLLCGFMVVCYAC